MKSKIPSIFFAGLLICLLPFSASTQNRSTTAKLNRQVAITFDDLPATQSNPVAMKYVTTKLLEQIKATRIPAIGFVNEGKLYVADKLDPERVSLLKMWVDAGLELGNHTYSHVAIDQVSLAAYQQEVIRGETVTKHLLAERGLKLRYFRHTQLRTGPTLEYKQGLESFLAGRGYTIAPVTLDNNDYIFAAVYERAKRKGDKMTMKRIGDAYVPYMEQIFVFFENLSRDGLGYEVKQTLLLHANQLNADYFDDLIRMMKRRGYSFISLEEALKDSAYRLTDAQTTRGLSWLHRWLLAKGKKLQPEPAEPEFIRRLFETYQR